MTLLASINRLFYDGEGINTLHLIDRGAALRYTLEQYVGGNEPINTFSYVATEAEPEHTHEFLELVYVLSGSGQHLINGRSFPVGRGSLLFIAVGQTHAFQPEGHMEIINCLIAPEYIDKDLIQADNAMEILALSSFEDFNRRAEKLVPVITFDGREMLVVETLLEGMGWEFDHKNANYRAALKGYLLVLLTKLFRKVSDQAGILTHINRITPDMLKFIEDNYTRRISLDELARRCFYNPSYFSRVFKDCYGTSLTAFIAEKRILEADRLLRETDLSIEAIALKVGYGDRSQFYTAYKRIMGVAPGIRRSSLKAGG